MRTSIRIIALVAFLGSQLSTAMAGVQMIDYSGSASVEAATDTGADYVSDSASTSLQLMTFDMSVNDSAPDLNFESTLQGGHDMTLSEPIIHRVFGRARTSMTADSPVTFDGAAMMDYSMAWASNKEDLDLHYFVGTSDVSGPVSVGVSLNVYNPDTGTTYLDLDDVTSAPYAKVAIQVPVGTRVVADFHIEALANTSVPVTSVVGDISGWVYVTPEPNSLLLLGFGAAVCVSRRRKSLLR